jgi:O-antigen/teichoic acid export membrane protein
LVALASVFTRFVKILAEQGLADAIVQHVDPKKEHLDTAFWASALIGLALSGLLAGTAGLTANIVGEPDLAPVLAVLAVSVAIAGLGSVQIGILTRQLAFGSLTARKLFAVVVSGIAGVAAALAGLGVWSLVVLRLTSEIVGVATLWRVTDYRPGLHFSTRLFGQMLSFGSNVVGFRIMNFFKKRSDNLLIGSFLGSAALGFYTIGYRMLNIMIDLTTAIVGMVAFPVFSRTQLEPERTQTAFYKAIRFTSLLAFPAFLGLMAIAPEATRLIFGSKWEPSIPVMRVLALAGLLQSVMFVNGVLLKALGKPSWRFIITTIEAVVSVAAFLVVVQYGIVAVATAFVVVGYALAPITLIATHRLMPLEPRRYVRQFGPALGASLAMVAVVFGTKTLVADLALVWQVLVLVLSGAATYFGVLWLTARSTAIDALRLARLALKSGRGQPELTSK